MAFSHWSIQDKKHVYLNHQLSVQKPQSRLLSNSLLSLPSPSIMAASLPGTSLSSTSTATEASIQPTPTTFRRATLSWKQLTKERRSCSMVAFVQPPSTPEIISEKVKASIEAAKETCKGNAESGECAAAWDEVEELSAAASHARDRLKTSDPLETFCNDNPETEECRTYED
ncbi:putative calvin cycle protein CP12 [Dioscorea sansibarensis]